MSKVLDNNGDEDIESGSLNGVSEKVCRERVKRIESKINTSMDTIVSNITSLDEKMNMVVVSHTNILDRHERDINNVCDEVKGIAETIAGITQWKINGERREDVWYRRQTVKTGLLVLIVGIISNINKIWLVLKGLMIAINGGKP